MTLTIMRCLGVLILSAYLSQRAVFTRPVFFWGHKMHLLYIDESGAVTDPNQRFFILAGVAIFERKTHWVEQSLNAIAERFYSQDPWEIELHGSPMRSGREGWKKFPLEQRLTAMDDVLKDGVVAHFGRNLRLFGAVIDKEKISGVDPVEHAFEQLVSRFDLFLKRLHTKGGDSQRGLMLLDKSSTERRIQSLAREFKYAGHSWGTTKNYAEVPVFLDSKASRLIQLADMVAFALFRFYEHQDDRFYNLIKDCFDSEGGVEHGLYVKA